MGLLGGAEGTTPSCEDEPVPQDASEKLRAFAQVLAGSWTNPRRRHGVIRTSSVYVSPLERSMSPSTPMYTSTVAAEPLVYVTVSGSPSNSSSAPSRHTIGSASHIAAGPWIRYTPAS